MRCLRLSPDGSRLACGDRAGNLRVYAVREGSFDLQVALEVRPANPCVWCMWVCGCVGVYDTYTHACIHMHTSSGIHVRIYIYHTCLQPHAGIRVKSLNFVCVQAHDAEVMCVEFSGKVRDCMCGTYVVYCIICPSHISIRISACIQD